MTSSSVPARQPGSLLCGWENPAAPGTVLPPSLQQNLPRHRPCAGTQGNGVPCTGLSTRAITPTPPAVPRAGTRKLLLEMRLQASNRPHRPPGKGSSFCSPSRDAGNRQSCPRRQSCPCPATLWLCTQGRVRPVAQVPALGFTDTEVFFSSRVCPDGRSYEELSQGLCFQSQKTPKFVSLPYKVIQPLVY